MNVEHHDNQLNRQQIHSAANEKYANIKPVMFSNRFNIHKWI